MGDFSGWSCDCESGYPAGADLGREAGEVPVIDTEVGGRGEKTLQPPSPLVLQPAPDTGHPEAIRNEAVHTMTYVATYDIGWPPMTKSRVGKYGSSRGQGSGGNLKGMPLFLLHRVEINV